MPLTKDEQQEIAGLFVGQMVPLLDQREEEKKANEGAFRQEIQNSLDAVNNRITEIETKGKRPTSGSGASVVEIESDAAHRMVAFKNYVRKGYFGMPRDQRELLLTADGEDIEGLQRKAQEIRAETKAFSIADDTLGGYFVLPEQVTNEIIKASVLYSPVRDLAKVQPTSLNTVEIPVRRATLTAGWVAETGTRAETTGQNYGKANIPTHEMYALVLFSRQLLADSFFNLEVELRDDISEQFGVLEGAAFVSGDGVGKPQGFLSNVTTNINTAAGSTAITYTDLVKTLMKLKPAYRNSPNCKWAMNQNVLSTVRQIVDGSQRPIFMPYMEGMASKFPGTIMGYPYVEATDMPSAVSGTNRTVAVGDFMKAYRFIDRVQMAVQRLEELYATSGQIGLLINKRVGGQLVLEEALAVLKQS
jgi:HK97 family phage major capsid protein